MLEILQEVSILFTVQDRSLHVIYNRGECYIFVFGRQIFFLIG